MKKINKQYSDITEKNKEYFIKELLSIKNEIKIYIEIILNKLNEINKEITSKRIIKYNNKYKAKLISFLDRMYNNFDSTSLDSILQDSIETIKFGTSLNILLSIMDNFEIQIDSKTKKFLELIEIYGRNQLKYQSKIDEKVYYKIQNTYKETENKNIKDTIFHPEKNIYDTYYNFLSNLQSNQDIDTVYLTSYGLAIENKGNDNSILDKIIEISKKKKLYIILDPILKFDTDKLKEDIEYLKKNGLNIIIPNMKVHGKMIAGFSQKNNEVHYILSSGNIVRPRINDGEYSKEDISIKGKSSTKNDIGKDIYDLFNYLPNKTLNKPNIGTLLVSPLNNKEKIIKLIKQETKEIYIATNVFYDREIYKELLKRANKGVKINVVIRDGKNILLDKDTEGHKNISFFKRRKKGKVNQQHSRMYYFKEQNKLFTGSIGCDTYRFNKSMEILFETQISDDFEKLMNNQLSETKKIN